MSAAPTPTPSDAADSPQRSGMGSGAMFDGIAHRYDFLNRVLSMGIDHSWRRKTVRALGEADRVLDLATGTADLAIAVAKTRREAEVVGLDPSANMLAVGDQKLERRGLDGRVRLEVGDAQALPYEDDAFDGCCMAFGIRNVPDRAAALREMARVVRPGGRVAILELNEPRRGLLSGLARFWIRKVVPRLGALLSGSREYRYLQESIAAFPPPEEFAALMESCGLEMREVQRLTFGVCCLYVAEVPR
ncbi:MAG TPA: bifunctional demethylmenaquinone methyltransferase/2-methoxy-6-polyprenyl-1,4-benzoquinol methylase UbiE [Polyangiaceae bacterium LLY-WYZ-15_(1-7)]|nr:bifunctional demethylmenaquinone methyltransferase/2-methoxy-6-polyprenyl-1,4-benzoquinol methylase UbiE [Polyangiaceae bacterium LLY-WYZ-15_(1-7)]HJL02851.1 bifunctional demethylmenaquinone methyltransferase/2-methoxy-6-polyprenyl-1,4-benzoquinol methylase UbiE [Polyangiaceae bacterium LLY-WYZ-15_(1-7)]HJL12179.1 bifunctional demethylmenaquinone methyltransferase/2-methoxy-6-polyprenyl-1,4-benzoquinol methylase UbiE [Polyangiaceae bacterium LLY-WYZ-15_(1-7)]HJL23589.1 bifunctional demethylme